MPPLSSLSTADDCRGPVAPLRIVSATIRGRQSCPPTMAAGRDKTVQAEDSRCRRHCHWWSSSSVDGHLPFIDRSLFGAPSACSGLAGCTSLRQQQSETTTTLRQKDLSCRSSDYECQSSGAAPTLCITTGQYRGAQDTLLGASVHLFTGQIPLTCPHCKALSS